jgi:hypothetical protein
LAGTAYSPVPGRTPERTRTYEFWIEALDEPGTRAQLTDELRGWEISNWELEELVEATEGKPEVITTWPL